MYAALPVPPQRERTVADVVLDTLLAWGMTHVFGMVGHSNLGLADAMRVAEERGELTYVGIRHEGARRLRRERVRQVHRPHRRLLRDRRTGARRTC